MKIKVLNKKITIERIIIFLVGIKSRLIEYIQEIISSQHELILLWAIIFYGVGICLYFSLNTEPKIIYSTLFICFCIVYILLKKSIVFTILLAASLGFISASIKTKILDTPTLEKPIKYCYISGIVAEISPTTQGIKLIINEPQISNYLQKLRKIRLLVKTSLNNAKVGDEIKIMANITPPLANNIPDGYNFALYSYFEEIGAVGYAISEVKIIKKNPQNSLVKKIARFRAKMLSDINGLIGPRTGNIAAALMIGEYHGIDKKILSDMRISGISHILSVSGMHLSLMAMLCFFFTRVSINLFYNYTARLHAKKIAAFIALIGSFAYLLISGLQVAALRAFIMVAMTIIAVIIDRTYNAMRAIFFAGFIILLFSPQNILNPSFQMSFAAVIALIASYNIFIANQFLGNNIFDKMKFYLLSSTFSSVIASIATAPYVLYHFNQFSNYSIISNLIALPITSFVLMPAVILAFILYPLNLEKLALVPMSIAIECLIALASYITNLPYSYIITPNMPTSSLLFFTIAGLLISLLKDKKKSLGLIPLILAVILMILNPKPILMIDGKTKVFAFFDENHNLVFSSKKLGKYTKENWLKYCGQKYMTKYYDAKTTQTLKFNGKNCYYNTKNTIIALSCSDISYLHFTGIINFNKKNWYFINNHEVIFVYLKNNDFLIKSTIAKNRPWHKTDL